jgi:hypothetical protein
MACTCTTPKEFAARVALGPVVEGDEWDGHDFTIEVRTSAPGVVPVTWGPPDANLTAVVMQFHTDETNLDSLEELTSAASEITITSANDWEFTINKKTLALTANADRTPATYFIAIRCQDADGGYKTYIKGTFIIDGKGVV